MYELVVFDWDGTLMDSAQHITWCMRHALQDVGLPHPQTNSEVSKHHAPEQTFLGKGIDQVADD